MSNAASLFDRTNAALIAGRWSEARRLLDDLARTPHADQLVTPPSVQKLAPGYREVIVDRIELVNATAGR